MPSFFSYAAEVLTDLLVCETKISKKKTQKLLDKKMTSRENIFLMLVSEKLYVKYSMYIQEVLYLSVVIYSSNLFQIHEKLRHYERQSPTPVLHSAAGLVEDVSKNSCFPFFPPFFFKPALLTNESICALYFFSLLLPLLLPSSSLPLLYPPKQSAQCKNASIVSLLFVCL